MKEKLKKVISIFTITIMLVFPITRAQAFEIPDPPPAPTPPPVEETQVSTPPPAPETPTAAPSPETVEPTITDIDADTEETPEPQDLTAPESQPESDTGGNVGDTTINTGDGLTAGTLTTIANSNTALQEPAQTTGNQTEVANTNNGTDSTNSASTEGETSTNIIQDNNAVIGNDLDLNTTTGESSASQNVGNSEIATGDANTSATAVTIANTNLAGLTVSEFNVIDDTQGDLILDFASGCIIGCGGSDTFQNNEATLENDITLAANTGYNQADQNTGGNSEITTGDANVSANVINFLNNNIAGNIILGVVNIFGDLIGDIILPEEELNTSLTTANNTGNGSGSTENTTFQTNDALIQNNLDFAANTGENQTSQNTGGNSIIETGEATIESQTINIANSNIDGGNWWLVLVNEAGQWLGTILGSETGSNIAGSEGTQFTVNPDGDITVTNQDNGAGSVNTVQNNVAQIINNINLFANTGGNSASKNTGGNSTIKTGDASVIANLVNFVNNNISGGGRLTITVVNVFGSWIGDFVTPGTQKEATGGPNPSNPLQNSLANQITTTTSQVADNQQINQPSNTPQPMASSISASNPDLNESNQTYVAGIEFDNSQGGTPLIKQNSNKIQDKPKTVELNLAWLLLLLPLGGTFTVIKLKKRLIS